MKPMNLKNFLEEYKVEIPLLQRDYAQGRKSQIGLAMNFLDSIFEVLEGSKDCLDIDFIYGYHKESKFFLIDGQQRITTLWLIYLLLHKKVGKKCESLGNFLYTVRKGSKIFCKSLLHTNFDVSSSPSQTIKNMVLIEKKFIENDPTVIAMLNMLDLIYDKVKNKDLQELEKCIERFDYITFTCFNMENYGLGEELYIKMNSRGKQLSIYENLKAYIEQKLEVDDPLLVKIDNNWSDFFFRDSKIEKFDERGRNFLHYANIFLKLVQKEKLTKEWFEKNRIDCFYNQLQIRENIEILDKVITLIVDGASNAKCGKFKVYEPDFFDNKQGDLSYIHICYFFSILSYVKAQNNFYFGNEKLEDYLRVCKHLIENHRLDRIDDIPDFFKLFESIAQGGGNIYAFLSKRQESSFHSNIYALEVRKAKLILESREEKNGWEEILNTASDHQFLVGRVDFLLDFCDDEFQPVSYEDSAFYSKGRAKEPFSSSYKKPNLERFIQYIKLTIDIFDFINNKEGLILFQRAYLSIGDYGFEATNWYYGSIPLLQYRDREAWNWLLSGIKNHQKMPYFKELLDRLLELEDSELGKKLHMICEECNISQRIWWEQLMIKDKKMFAYLSESPTKFQETRRIRFIPPTKDSLVKVELLPKTKSRIDVHDLFDYAFYCYCKECQIDDRLGLAITDYDCSEEQCGFKKGKNAIKSHFSLDEEKVVCHSGDQKINIGNEEFAVDFVGDICIEFERIYNEYISSKES